MWWSESPPFAFTSLAPSDCPSSATNRKRLADKKSKLARATRQYPRLANLCPKLKKKNWRSLCKSEAIIEKHPINDWHDSCSASWQVRAPLKPSVLVPVSSFPHCHCFPTSSHGTTGGPQGVSAIASRASWASHSAYRRRLGVYCLFGGIVAPAKTATLEGTPEQPMLSLSFPGTNDTSLKEICKIKAVVTSVISSR